MSNDDAVRSTNDDAATCKRSAVQLGYWKDPYIQYFIRTSERKAPEINRGYFARVRGIQVLLKQFLELTKCECQVVNLGAGFDTTYWNLKDEGLAPKNFVEMDFQGVTNKKSYYIKHRKQLLEKLSGEDGEVRFNQFDMHAPSYHVVSADMRNLTEVQQKLVDCRIDKSLPTVFIAECVLVYMTSDSTSDLMKWIAESFPTAFFINYEQVNMEDRFGQVMVENLKTRGCSLAGVEHCKSLETQKQRFLVAGWESAEAWDMIQVYKSLPHAEVKRFQGLEMLSELQDELFSHHCICWAYVDRRRLGMASLGLHAPD